MLKSSYYKSELLLLIAFLSLLCFGTGCKTTVNKNEHSENIVNFTATVRYIDIEGGFWGLISSDGKKYEPRILDNKYLKDGLKVRVKARILKDTAGFRMWGKQVEIINIGILKSKASENN